MKEKLQIEVICELCLFFATICEPLTFLGYSTNSSSNCRVKETRSFVPPVHTPTATFAMTVFYLLSLLTSICNDAYNIMAIGQKATYALTRYTIC